MTGESRGIFGAAAATCGTVLRRGRLANQGTLTSTPEWLLWAPTAILTLGESTVQSRRSDHGDGVFISRYVIGAVLEDARIAAVMQSKPARQTVGQGDHGPAGVGHPQERAGPLDEHH